MAYLPIFPIPDQSRFLGQIQKAEPFCGSPVTRRPFGPRAAAAAAGLVNAAEMGSPVYGVVLISARANRKLRTGPFVLTSIALTR
jgi:hypothetical protein